MRTLTLMWQDQNTGTGQCPAIYSTEGGYVIQGKTTDRASVVFIVDNVIDRLAPGARASIAYALADTEGGYQAAGDPLVDEVDISQLFQFAKDESAVYVAAVGVELA